MLSRDAICDVVREEQGAAEGSRLRRLMRAQDYGGVMGLVMRGYAAALPFNAYGALGSARGEDDINSASSQFF